MPYSIYIHTSPSNKSYIGLTCDYERRCKEHQNPSNRCIAFASAIQKYGWDTFIHSILHENIETLEEAKEIEKYYIKEYNTIAPNGYNLTEGGEGIKSEIATNKTKNTLIEKYGVDNPGKLDHSREKAKERMTNNNPGKHDKETLDKIRKTNIDRMKEMTLEERSIKFGSHGKNNAFYGKKHTEETIQKMIIANEKYEYTLISPEGIKYITRNLNQFCKDYHLERKILTHYINKSIIIPPARCDAKEFRINTSGWSISAKVIQN